MELAWSATFTSQDFAGAQIRVPTYDTTAGLIPHAAVDDAAVGL